MTDATRRDTLEEAARICEARVDGFKRVADERLYAGLQEEAAHWRTKLETAEEIASAIRAAAQSAPDGWLPIESAPKDGTKLLLGYAASSFINIGYWEPEWIWRPSWTDGGHAYNPTHYRPLPPAPTQSTP